MPEEPTSPHDLPAPSPQIAELLSRWQRRRARLNRIYWIGLRALIGGYAIIVEAFWNLGAQRPRVDQIDDFVRFVPPVMFIPLIMIFMFLFWYFFRDSESGFRWRVISPGNGDDGSGNRRHGTPAALIAIWRILILLGGAFVVLSI